MYNRVIDYERTIEITAETSDQFDEEFKDHMYIFNGRFREEYKLHFLIQSH